MVGCFLLPRTMVWKVGLILVMKVFAILGASHDSGLKPLLTPKDCLCPDQNYTCVVNSGLTIAWRANSANRDILAHSVTDDANESYVENGGFQVTFRTVQDTLTSTLHVRDLGLNETNLTCEGIYSTGMAQEFDKITDTTAVCVVGPSSPPTGLSVVYDSSSSAVVGFQSPVYGGECVDHYVVTAVSEERNVSCNVNSSYGREYSCNISVDGNVNDYRFTVYSVTLVNDSFYYEGDNVSDCCLPFPENITAVEERCGDINVSWESSHNITSVNTTISWVGVSGATRQYERVISEDSHLLTLDYSETGPVEISVTFSSHLCNKTTVITYLVEGVLTSVYLRSRTLVIESRDCIADLQNYSIIITTPTTMMNVSFNTTVEYDLEYVSPGTIVTVQLVETTSNTIIYERNYTIPYPTPTITPTVTPTEPVVGGSKPEKDSRKVIQIAAGLICGVGVGVLIVVVVTVALLVWRVRNRRSKHAINVKGEELKILGSPQVSVEEGKRSCDPPQTPAPAVPDSVSRPDVVPSLYAELDTLSRQKKEEPAALPMYHVLEGPTPVETTPDTQESETPATDAPVYSMVDKSKKKKKNRGSESSATATPPASDIPVYSMVDKSKKKKNRGSKPSTTVTEEEEEGEKEEEVTSI